MKPNNFRDKSLQHLIAEGSVGVIPTDTIYGLVCSAKLPESCARLFKIKQRIKKPGTIIAADIDQLVELGIKKRYLKAVEQFWPGPVSVIIPTAGKELEYLHLGKESLAVRLPIREDLVNFLKKTGPLLTSSANITDQAPAKNVKEVKKYFGDNIDFFVDGGEIDNPPSTILQIIDDEVVTIRRG